MGWGQPPPGGKSDAYEKLKRPRPHLLFLVLNRFCASFLDFSTCLGGPKEKVKSGRISPIALGRYIAKQFGEAAHVKFLHKLPFT